MSTHTIEISELVYRRLNEQAAQLQLTPEQLIERLLMADLLMHIKPSGEVDELMPAPNVQEALAAVERLATCFADVKIPDLEATLADPMIALANVDVDNDDSCYPRSRAIQA